MSSRRICLLTSTHLTNCPRLIKEARGLSFTGFALTIVACQYDPVLSNCDAAILGNTNWEVRIVDYSRDNGPRLYWWSRFRRLACAFSLSILRKLGVESNMEWLEIRAVHRVLPEILREGRSVQADLYVGHNPGLLPVAKILAAENSAKCGFDVEDLHSGMTRRGEKESLQIETVRRWEKRYLSTYDYLTAASPLIAEEYSRMEKVSFEAIVLNAFEPAYSNLITKKTCEEPIALYWLSQTIGAHRGIENVVRALAYLNDFPLLLYLRGAWQPGYEKMLRELAEQVHVEQGRIVALTKVGFDELVDSATAYDVGLAVEEPTCRNREICITNKILMYLSSGLAIAATATPAQVDLMKRIPDAGFVYPWNDHEALANGLRNWIQNPQSLASAKAAAHHAARSLFNCETEQSKVRTVVERVLQ